ncbi:MAG: class I tRNA ligase family protein [bacterium]|nr:class I tRNA ligase family protein [bacterium]
MDKKSAQNTEKAETAQKIEKSKVALREEEILKFWEENKIFKKSLEKNSPLGEYVFYDGPPFATGTPHYGHILAGTIKDAVTRYKTMRGYHVPRKWGWDCHGLPVENLIEKELGLKSKIDIEKMGIAKFNSHARASVLRYAHIWRELVPRFGRWVDMDNDYRTMDSSYTESVWWVFSELYKKGLIYEGFKSMHLCPHCETTLSNFEVNQGYKDITDISVYVKFELVKDKKWSAEMTGNSEGNPERTFLVAWTTTPWTLPGNSALAINPEITYVKVKNDNDILILAKDRLAFLSSVLKKELTSTEEFKGKELLDKRYKPLFDYYFNDKELKNRNNGWKVYGAEFVTTTDGTGIVHIAPAFGSDDYDLSLKEKLPFIQHVGTDGKFRKEVTDFAGQNVKPKNEEGEKGAHQRADIEIIKNLAGKGVLLAKEKLIHSYPHCWRCYTPLLNYATSSWFVEVSKFKDKLVKANSKVKWVPEEIGEGRFGKWLEGARDWAISRSRYWGAPLPVWKCVECKKVKVISSLDDIIKANPEKNKYLVMRHGESNSNVAFNVSDDIKNDDHLTDNGKKQIEEISKKLAKEKIDLIISSPFPRTMETANIVAENIGYDKNNIIKEDRLIEIQTGGHNGQDWKEFNKHFGSLDKWASCNIGDSESICDVRKRIVKTVDDLEEKYKGKNILIISHGAPVRIMRAISDKISFYDINFEDVKNGEYYEVKWLSKPRNEDGEIDFHRPFIDEVVMDCKCGGKMKRVPEVFDCWFESGAMPYGEVNYKGVKNKDFHFPADFIGEGQDQTRGWFYSMIVLGVALFGESPYKNVLVNGMLLAEDGQKMSKSKRNYPDPVDVINKFGMDAVRYYMLSSPAVNAEDIRFTESGVDEVSKKNINRLDNVISFYEMYSEGNVIAEEALNSKNVLDEWLIVKLNELVNSVSKGLESYELGKASRPIAPFIEDLSVWYLRRSRDRFKSDDEKDKRFALATTKYVLRELSKVMAPFMPFFAESLYQRLSDKDVVDSVHLANWPLSQKISEKDEKILKDMHNVRNIVTLGLEARSKANIKVRQPLASLAANITDLSPELLELIKDELNVKKVIQIEGIKNGAVNLDTNISKELNEEGMIRDLIRALQEQRKKMGLIPSDLVSLSISKNELVYLDKIIMVPDYEVMIKKVAGVKEIKFNEIDKGLEIEIAEKKIKVSLEKV